MALGRKNYLFYGNDASAYRAAIVYSLISTCKVADIDPRTWMEDVLRKIPYYQRDQVPRIDLDETLFPPEKAAPQPEYTTSGCYDPKLRELAEMARSASAVAEDDEPKEN